MYGKPPPTTPIYVDDTSSIDAYKFALATCYEILAMLQKKVTKAHNTMKTTTDKHCGT